MVTLSVRLFGPLQVAVDGVLLRRYRSNKAKALLGYLIAEQGFADWLLEHQREKLMALLWPDFPPRRAQASLRQALFQLQLAINSVGPEPGQSRVFLRADRQTIGIHPEAVYYCDLTVFLKTLESIKNHKHKHVSLCSSCLADLTKVAELYRGEFLADLSLANSCPFEEWALLRREQLSQQVLRALNDITETALRFGDYQLAQATAWRQLEIDSFRDRAYLQLMVAQVGEGNRAGALLTYHKYCSVLDSEMQIAPAFEVQALAHSIQTGSVAKNLELQ